MENDENFDCERGNIDEDFALGFLKERRFDRVIAVDKGARFCYKYGIEPFLLTGDFDSLEPEILRDYEKKGIPTRRFRPEKDETDMELALWTAKEMIGEDAGENAGACRDTGNGNTFVRADGTVTILGGTGSRLDHMMGTLYAMAGFGPEIPCELVDVNNRVRMLWPGVYRVHKKDCFGPFLSLLPIGGRAAGITLTGFKYPLSEHVMTCDNSLGVSNELTEEEGCIAFREGLLACFETRDL